MPFNVSALIFFLLVAGVMLFMGEFCLATVFFGAAYVHFRLERIRRRVIDRPDPWER